MTCDLCEHVVELSYFSMSTGKLAEVMYEQQFCNKPEITMLCSYVMANNRYSGIPITSLFKENSDSIENENISDDELDLFSDKRKIRSEIVNDKLTNNAFRQIVVDDSETVNSILKSIGYVCSSYSKMYTVKPIQIFYHIPNINDYNPYINYFTPKKLSNNSICNLNNLSIGKSNNHQIIPYNSSPETRNCNNINDNTNFHKVQKIFKKNTRSNSTNIQWNKRCNIHKKNVFSARPQKGVPLKYWAMRYTLFSKFDHGIQLDHESFYSVCPEILSYHIAKRCKNLIALDPFCGAGGNIIQLALTCKFVIAIDIDPYKIKLAKHNAEIYGVANKIEFIVGDFFNLAPILKADVVFMSPPWGGPGYWNYEIYSIESMCEKHFGGGFDIFNKVKSVAPNIAFHMPKTTNIYECLWLAKDFGRVEIQQNIVNGKLNSITAFFGSFTDVTNDDY